MSGEPETRRSARATKGQHKALDALDQPQPPKKRGKKGKKVAEEPEPEEEIIRCVCGATEQDEDTGEVWICCEQCSAWQHNVCVGISTREEDAKDLDYYCEICRPEDHKPLLDALARGEKLWETRRKKYEEEEAAEEAAKGKKKKGAKKGKGKRASDPKESTKQEPEPSPVPEPPKKEAKAAAGGKRKARDESQDKEPKPPKKARKGEETQAVPAAAASATPATPAYTPPADIATKISDLKESARQNAATGLFKRLKDCIRDAERKQDFNPKDGVPRDERAERLALQIERAVHDTHQGEHYTAQARTIWFNMKSNKDLGPKLLKGTLTPTALAAMTPEELQSKELQRETAEIKARNERQSILTREDQAPRVRRTHKGEEVVSDDTVAAIEEAPVAPIRRNTIVKEQEPESVPPAPEATEQQEPSVELPEHIEQSVGPRNALHIDTAQASPKTDFDINKVFSSVKSPSAPAVRRQSTALTPATKDDADVDRMLQDDDDEPPYSPSEESDPDVIWRGNLHMNTIADFKVVAKHVGGAKLPATNGVPWMTLFPDRLSVAGRIDQQKAIEYLCAQRYSPMTDLVVTALEPATPASKPVFHKIIDYFVSKGRYGVVGPKSVANVRDTYLIPILPGTGGHPEFMLNLNDNFIPETRREKWLLCVFVYRNDEAKLANKLPAGNSILQASSQSPVASTPTPTQATFQQRTQSISGPQFSPATPQAPQQSFQSPMTNQTPVHPPQVPHNGQPSQLQQPQPPHAPQNLGPSQLPPKPQPQPLPPQQLPGVPVRNPQVEAAQRDGERIAREVLGPLISSPTLAFILPHAHRMLPKEWHLIRDVYERDPVSREDLNRLSTLLDERSKPANSAAPPPQKQQQQPLQAPQQARAPQQQQQFQAQGQPGQPAQAPQPPRGQLQQPAQPPQLQHPQAVQMQQQQVQQQARQAQPQPQLQPPTQQQQFQPPPPQQAQQPKPPVRQQPQPAPQVQAQQPQFRAPPAQQTPIPPPVVPPQTKTTPIPPPAVPAAGPPRQTPIPPPNIPHNAAPAPTA